MLLGMKTTFVAPPDPPASCRAFRRSQPAAKVKAKVMESNAAVRICNHRRNMVFLVCQAVSSPSRLRERRAESATTRERAGERAFGRGGTRHSALAPLPTLSPEYRGEGEIQTTSSTKRQST